MCSASSSSKSESLEKSCSLLPQTVAVLFCDYSQHLTGEIHIHCDSLPAALHQSGSTHRLCFSSLLGILPSILVEWWGRGRIHYSGFLLCVFSPLICFATCRTYSRDDSCSSSRNTPLVPSVTSASRWEGWLLTENCHTDLGPLLVLFSKPFKPHSADIQICFDTIRRKNFSPLHLKNLRGVANGLWISEVVLLVFLPATTVKEIFSNVPLKISNSKEIIYCINKDS